MVRASPLWKHDWIAGLLAVAVTLALQFGLDAFAGIERRLYDRGLRSASHTPAADITIVAIDQASEQKVAPWPWPREALAQLVDRVSQAGAALIVLALPLAHPQPEVAQATLSRLADALGGDPSLAGNPAIAALADEARNAVSGDVRLAASLKTSGRVLLASQPGAAPIAPFAKAAAAVADATLHPDADGVLRTHPLFTGAEMSGPPVMALEVAARRQNVPLFDIRRIAEAGVRLGATLLPTEEGARVRPHFYRGQAGKPAFAQLSAADVHAGRVSLSQLAGQTVLVGLAGGIAPVATPIGIAMAPVEALAHIASSLSRRHLVHHPAWAASATWLAFAAVGILLMWRFPRSAGLVRLGWALAISVLLLGAQWLLQTRALLWVPLTVPVIALWLGVFVLAAWPRGRPLARERPASDAQDGDTRPERRRHLRRLSDAALASASDAAERVTLGRYRIEREIGRGSMGAVLLGHDTQSGQAVAIKTMALGDEFEGDALIEARQRFIREAETAGRLKHPDIVQILDTGENRELAWIAMEYLGGRDLTHYTRPSTLLATRVVLRICARVADALALAHSLGVVHRDIKPANVMVDLPADAVKVTDFGIARIADASRTRSGMVLGTPSFMSPEQMAGGEVDGRSDVYSLGVMLFQLLSGRLPFEGDSMGELMQRIANEAAPDLRQWRPDLPESLANVVALALQKRPEVRYADARELAADLRAVAAHLPADRLPPTRPGDEREAFAATVQFPVAEPRHNSEQP